MTLPIPIMAGTMSPSAPALRATTGFSWTLAKAVGLVSGSHLKSAWLMSAANASVAAPSVTAKIPTNAILAIWLSSYSTN